MCVWRRRFSRNATFLPPARSSSYAVIPSEARCLLSGRVCGARDLLFPRSSPPVEKLALVACFRDNAQQILQVVRGHSARCMCYEIGAAAIERKICFHLEYQSQPRPRIHGLRQDKPLGSQLSKSAVNPTLFEGRGQERFLYLEWCPLLSSSAPRWGCAAARQAARLPAHMQRVKRLRERRICASGPRREYKREQEQSAGSAPFAPSKVEGSPSFAQSSKGRGFAFHAPNSSQFRPKSGLDKR
jgi:hypothetical protein